jgi:protease-4
MRRALTASALALFSGLAITSSAALAAGVKVGFFDLEHAPSEQPSPLAWLMGGEPTIRDITATIDAAAKDPELKALVINLKLQDEGLTTTQVEEIGARLKKLRDSGKKVSIFSETYGPAELILGSYADEVIVQKGGAISFPGLYMEEMFLADTLQWAGLKADMVQIGDYKGAKEQMSNSAPSKEWDQNISQLLDSMYANQRTHLKEGRKLSDAELDKAMEVAWMAEPGPAIAAKLADAEVDLRDLDTHLASTLGGEVEWTDDLLAARTEKHMDSSNPLAMLAQVMATEPPTEATEPTIAILHVDGTIVDGESTDGGMFGDKSVGSRTLRRAIDDILDDDMIKGVVVRIDSPGGSAMASEVMWQGLRKLAAEKPVWASVGSMAASGGYYVASGTDKVYVNPSSIVGSIGVVGGKIAMGGLYDKLQVKIVERSRGPRAAMFSSTRTWTDVERGMIASKMKETYDLFTSRVTAGRKGIDLSKTAEGRLFTGDKAIGLKMADQVGGLDDCIADLAKSVGLSEYEVMDFPGPKSLGEVIGETLGGFVSAPGSVRGAAKDFAKNAAAEGFMQLPAEIAGPRAWSQIRQGLGSVMLLRKEPVLVVTPKVFIWR